MKLLVISDTHRYISNAVSLIEEHKPDVIVHLGDVAEDCDELRYIYPMKRIICVLGNNDYFNKSYPLEVVCELGGKKFFMCHGHKYNVKYGLFAMMKRARELEADVVLFGHTHKSMCEKDGTILVMNPGSIRTYGIIEIDNNGNINAYTDEA
ncbi:MAG: metallophosphoesterase [Clostridia bacterium]|nr:metallophosphoesterase [Clostridia bacterium]